MGLYFNLSEEEREFAKQKTMFCLIIYDIRSNKRRLKLSKLLGLWREGAKILFRGRPVKI